MSQSVFIVHLHILPVLIAMLSLNRACIYYLNIGFNNKIFVVEAHFLGPLSDYWWCVESYFGGLGIAAA